MGRRDVGRGGRDDDEATATGSPDPEEPTWGQPKDEDAPRPAREDRTPLERVEAEPVVRGRDELDQADEELLASVMAAADAENTAAAYKTDLRQFSDWCREKGLRSFGAKRAASPKVVALWATSLAQQGRKVATIERKLAAVSSAHTRLGLDSPCREQEVKRTLAGLRRKLGVEQDKVLALEGDHLRRILDASRPTLRWKRDRAILLLGFACAMRREEVVRVELKHMHFVKDEGGRPGLSVFLPDSKTDQEGRGEWKHVPSFPGSKLCPVRAVKLWLKRSGITKGYVFRRIYRSGKIDGRDEQHLAPQAVLAIVRKAVRKIGEKPELYGGHSLRAGMVTTAKAKGKDNITIARQTGHKNMQTLEGYNRPRDVFGPSNPLHGLLD